MAIPFRYNALSLAARPTSTISSIALIALVIATFAYLQAVTDSAFNTMAGTGDDKTLIVLAQSANSETVSGLTRDQLNKLGTVPDVVRDGAGPLVSEELVAISSARTREAAKSNGKDDVKVNTAVRGVEFEPARKVRHDRVRLLEGRVFQPGTYEVIVGSAAQRLYDRFNVGDEVQLGTRGMRSFKIVGVFTTGGTAADSEIWGYGETLRDVYSRNGYSSARMLVTGDEAARKAIAYIEGPSVALTAKTERQYFEDLNTNQSMQQTLSIAMILIMGIAAAFAVANTMYAAVAGRTREIGMLRAIGFGPVNILNAFVLEGILLALGGGLLGALISLCFNGMQRSILPQTFTTVSYTLEVTPKIVLVSLAVSVAIGLVGSIMPAWRAAKLGVTTALREA